MKILITGSNGYIGSQLLRILSNKYSCIGINRSVFDLTNNYETKKWFMDKFFDVVIHTAIIGGSRLKEDGSEVIDHNLKMYLNLLECKDHYNKFINIGSGAEVCKLLTPYGLSKRVIFESIRDKINFYSLRIFGLFDHKELDTRFIKNNLKRYIQKENLIIHQDKLMDFIYFEDFANIVNAYIENMSLPKNINCVYKKKYLLSDICNIINKLSDYEVNIEIGEEESVDFSYIGTYNNPGIEMHGLEEGILQTYRKLMAYHD